MKVSRAVVDTNVLISAFLSPNGTARKALDALIEANATLHFSQSTFAEFTSRITRPKFQKYFRPQMLENYVQWLSEAAEWVEPEVNVRACRDADDDQFLSLALAAEAQVIISGDKDLLVLHPFEGISIVNPAGYCASL